LASTAEHHHYSAVGLVDSWLDNNAGSGIKLTVSSMQSNARSDFLFEFED